MQTPPTTVPHPFAGSKDDEVPNKFDLARIEGARLAQLKMNAPSTVRGVQMSPLVSAEDVYAAELKHGTIPVVLQKPGGGHAAPTAPPAFRPYY